MCSATEQCQTELRADAVRQEARYSHSLATHSLSLLSALSWQVAQLLQVQRHHAVAAAAA